MNSIILFCYVFIFIIGVCIASFINVVVYRMPLEISAVSGRSICPKCCKTLKPYDLIPIVSWFLLKGKCRFCGQSISFRYPIIEFTGGVLGCLCFNHYGANVMTLMSFAFSMILLTISIIDHDTMIIPNELVIACFIIAIISIPFMNISILERIIGFFAVSLPLYLLNLFIPNCFGGGDIKLLAVCGLFLGWSSLIAGMVIAVVMAGTYAGYLLLRDKANRKTHIAFGPYICIGMFIALFYGEAFITLYLNLINF